MINTVLLLLPINKYHANTIKLIFEM
ncbi:hypothetical protein [Escherichia coli]